MSLLRSARFPAIVLLLAAGLGLFVANSAWGPVVDDAMHSSLGIPGVFELSLSHWIKDGLLAVFFFVVAVELQYELTAGQLNSARKALQPAIAAAGGVLIPIAIYAAMAWGSDASAGWPIPTATDIAFATGVNVAALAGAAVAVVGFGILSRQLDTRARVPIAVALALLAIATWVMVYLSGVHATIAGVALGLAMAQRPALRVRHELEPWVNVVVLPVFAFSAALVPIPSVPLSELSPAFWGVLVALPVGKVVGISLFGWIALRIGRQGSAPPLAFADLLAAGALGGIGFTVSLLLSELAFSDEAALSSTR